MRKAVMVLAVAACFVASFVGFGAGFGGATSFMASHILPGIGGHSAIATICGGGASTPC
jgi:hypothetical protein